MSEDDALFDPDSDGEYNPEDDDEERPELTNDQLKVCANPVCADQARKRVPHSFCTWCRATRTRLQALRRKKSGSVKSRLWCWFTRELSPRCGAEIHRRF